jgi:hypothetical protein
LLKVKGILVVLLFESTIRRFYDDMGFNAAEEHIAKMGRRKRNTSERTFDTVQIASLTIIKSSSFLLDLQRLKQEKKCCIVL